MWNIRLPNYFYYIILTLPFFLLLFLVTIFAVDVPFWDQWDEIYIFEKYFTGNLTVSDLFRQHNEHRIFFPKIIFLVVGVLTGYNVIYEMYINLFIALLSFGIIARHIIRNKAALNVLKNYLWYLTPLSLMMFSWNQYENWLWGFQLQWFLNILCVIAGAYILANYELNAGTFSLLSLFGTVAIFSLSTGMLYWIVVLLFFIINHIRTQKNHIHFIVIWILFFMISLLLYSSGYIKQSHHPSIFFIFKEPVTFLLYVFSYIGNAVSFGDDVSILFAGIIGITIFVYYTFRIIRVNDDLKFKKYSFFIFVGSFSVFSAMLTGLGRSGFGYEQAYASRYITVSMLLWISIFFFLLSDERSGRIFFGRFSMSHIRKMLIAVIFCGLLIQNFNSLEDFKKEYVNRMSARVSMAQGIEDYLSNIYPNPARLMAYDIPRLKQLKLSIFRDIPQISQDLFSLDNWIIEGDWSIGGIYPIDKKEVINCFGSWTGSDSHLGRITSNPMIIDGRMCIVMKVIHGPDPSHQQVGVKIIGKDQHVIFIKMNPIPHNWQFHMIDLSPYQGLEFSIFAEDNGSGWGQWVGFSQPLIIRESKNSKYF